MWRVVYQKSTCLPWLYSAAPHSVSRACRDAPLSQPAPELMTFSLSLSSLPLCILIITRFCSLLTVSSACYVVLTCYVMYECLFWCSCLFFFVVVFLRGRGWEASRVCFSWLFCCFECVWFVFFVYLSSFSYFSTLFSIMMQFHIHSGYYWVVLYSFKDSCRD